MRTRRDPHGSGSGAITGGWESGGFGVVGGGVAWRCGVGVGEVVDLADDVVPGCGIPCGLEEFALGKGDGFQEDFGEIGEGVGGSWGDAAFDDGGKEARHGEVEAGGGNDFADEGPGDAAGGVILLVEVTEFAQVVEAVFGVGRGTREAAATSIREGKGTQRRAVFGIVGRHKRLQKVNLDLLGRASLR